jgi:hypothetical protein
VAGFADFVAHNEFFVGLPPNIILCRLLVGPDGKHDVVIAVRR